MDDYSSEISEDPITSHEVLLSLRPHCLAVRITHSMTDVRHKQKHFIPSALNEQLPDRGKQSHALLIYFNFFISYISECSFNSLSVIRIHSTSCKNLLTILFPPLFLFPPVSHKSRQAGSMSAPWMNQYFHFNTVSIFN